MSRPRTCPHCGQVMHINEGFEFDKDFNVTHIACGKLVFGTDVTKGRLVVEAAAARNRSKYNSYTYGSSSYNTRSDYVHHNQNTRNNWQGSGKHHGTDYHGVDPIP